MDHTEIIKRLETLADNLQSIHDTQERLGTKVGLIAMKQQIKGVHAAMTTRGISNVPVDQR
jgi:hypothetical protein